MGMAEAKTLFFERTEGDLYIDLAAALTASNRKQFHQVARDGTPLCFSVTLESVGVRNVNSAVVCALGSNWTTRNAAKKAGAGWKAQLRHADVKLSDLPTYGRRPRFALNASSRATYTLTSGKSIEGLANNYSPQDCSGAELFNNYTDTAGDSISYKFANTVTTVAVDDGAGNTTEQPMVMLADAVTPNMFEVIPEYLDSRRNMETLETEAPGPSSSNKMTSLFSTAEEMSDDIIAAVSDYADNRPYDMVSADDLHMIGHFGTIAGDANTIQNPSAVSGEVPLGLLKVDGFETGDTFLVHVHAIYEM